MKLLWVFTAFTKSNKFSLINLDAIRTLCEERDVQPFFALIKPEASECEIENCQTIITQNKSQYKAVILSLKENFNLSEFDKCAIIDVKYGDSPEVIIAALDKIKSPCNFIKLKRDQSKVIRGISSFIIRIYGKIANLFVRAKPQNYLPGFNIIDKTIMEIACEFPNKFGLMLNTDSVINASYEEVIVPFNIKRPRHIWRNITSYLITSVLTILGIAGIIIGCVVKNINLQPLIFIFITSFCMLLSGVLFGTYYYLNDEIK